MKTLRASATDRVMTNRFRFKARIPKGGMLVGAGKVDLKKALATLACLSCLTALLGSVAGKSGSAPLVEQIRYRLESVHDPDALTADQDKLLCVDALTTFYERRGYRPAWFEGKKLSKTADELVGALNGARLHGLQPEDYHLKFLRQRISQLKRLGGDVELELFLSDAFLLLGSHLLSGQVNPETIDSEWFANRRGSDLAGTLEKAIETSSVRATLSELAPPQSGYRRLQEALATYRQIESSGGWPTIPEGEMLKPGVVDARVGMLRERLAITGDASIEATGNVDTYDDELEAAVRRFQRRHGLDDDGVVGPVTLAALNVPVTQRVRQIVINLERWRWLPQDLGERYVIVNIADFRLDCVEAGDSALSSRVIVGRRYRRTPVFTGELGYIVFGPNWEVPDLIAVEDIIPILSKDPSYLEKMGFDVLRGWGADEKRFEAASIDWTSITKDNFSFRLRQKPGPLNALGRMKFMFPNKFSVYMHDTPARELFGKTERTFSSGCIRVDKSVELAVWLMSGDTAYDERGIGALIETGETRTVILPRRVPIHLLYWTSWVDASGTVFFRRDIYGRDERLDAALRQDPPVVGNLTH